MTSSAPQQPEAAVTQYPAPKAEHDHDPPPFPQRYAKALADPQLQGNLLAFQRRWRTNRDGAFAAYAANPLHPTPDQADDATPLTGGEEFQALRTRLRAIKDEVVDHLPAYLDQFQREAEAAGIHVYRAATGEEANAYVLALCQAQGIDHVVKSKTMVSEEIELNAALEPHGIRVVETDLGEWIQQLAHERPSHMIAPAIHKNRAQVADLMSQATGWPVSREDIGAQVAVARRELRREFLAAGLGISGANALIASSGTVVMVTNEGNGRLVTTLPRVHVVLAGIEKIVPDWAAAMLQLRLLARSASGQAISTYTTFLSGPADPGKEMHIVLLDNGRTRMRDTPLIREALRCIRCAACSNVCPPYAVVGGHVFGHIYSGAIGLVNTPYHHGLEAASGPQSLCVSCNACATVCPVEIPLPQQILAVRAQVAEELGTPAPFKAAMAVWANPALADKLLRAAALASAPLRRGRFTRLPAPARALIPLVHRLTSWRTPPALARRTAQDRLKRLPPTRLRIPNQAEGLRVAYFVQCLTDRLFPGMALAVTRVLQACGVHVQVPEGQHCCGLPALDAGDPHHARVLARQTITLLENTQADYILTAGASCAAAMLHDYETLFADEPAWSIRAQVLAGRVIDFVTFMDSVACLAPGALALTNVAALEPVTYHNFCQSVNVLGLHDAPRRLIREVLGRELIELPESSVCCGFGGSTSVRHPAVASEILDRKLANVQATGARLLVTDNPGCILHLRGGIDAQGLPIRVLHLAELMAAHLPVPIKGD